MKITPTDEQILERTTRGWLRPYLIVIDQMFSKRWEYWLKTVEKGQVLDEPIPQIKWPGHGHPEPRKNLEICIDFCRNRFSRQAFSLFVEWLLFGFGDPSIQEMPSQVEPSLNAFWYKTFNLGLFLKYPHDYLGEYAADLYGKHNPTGYFPTPMNVSVMMAKMVLSEKDKIASVCDPCVGSGRLLMAASGFSLHLYGMDIDFTILQVCKTNMWMYVPWGVGRPVIKGLEPVNQPMDGLVQPVQKVTPEVQRKLLEYSQMELFGGK